MCSLKLASLTFISQELIQNKTYVYAHITFDVPTGLSLQNGNTTTNMVKLK